MAGDVSEPSSSGAANAAGVEDGPQRQSRHVRRSVAIVAWATGPAGLYALASMAHALLVERTLTVDIGFGRGLAYWVVSAYLALMLWGFLPRQRPSRFARPGIAYPLLGAGLLGLVVCGGFTLAWLGTRWNPGVGLPVLGTLAVMLVAAVGTLWLADRAEPAGP